MDRNNTTTDQLRQWAVLIDTGAMTSVASQEHFTHIPLKPLRPQDPQSQWSIISDVNCAILGLDTITKNNLQLRGLHTRLRQTLQPGTTV
eukprot:6050506-Amphidinium_carterae.4